MSEARDDEAGEPGARPEGAGPEPGEPEAHETAPSEPEESAPPADPKDSAGQGLGAPSAGEPETEPEPEAPAPVAEGPVSTPPPERALPEPLGAKVLRGIGQALQSAKAYVLEDEPRFWRALGPFTLLAIVLFTRRPGTNYIFDEQEALLANPYVNATQKLGFWDAIHRDFWGLPANASVGSYRPIPNFFWRTLWQVTKEPFFHHFYNVLFHAANAALLTVFAWRLTKRRDVAWMAGLAFVCSAVLTEAVSGIVGIADVFGGLGAIGALAALALPGWAMGPLVFVSILFALFSKESGIVLVPLVPFAALLTAPLLHQERPARWQRTFLALVGSALAFYFYVELRKRWFLSPLPEDVVKLKPGRLAVQALEASARVEATIPSTQYWTREFMAWFHQAPLPKDRLNNPLVDADGPHRVAGALRVYFRGLVQVVFPRTLSPDYSFPQEPIPSSLWAPEGVLGGLLMVFPPLASVVLWVVALVRERREMPRPAKPEDSVLRLAGRVIGYSTLGFVAYAVLAARWEAIDGALSHPRWTWTLARVFLGVAFGFGLALDAGRRRDPLEPDPPWRVSSLVAVALGMTWCVVSFFPHSNIPVVLPTVRAERFWYFPAIGTSLVLAIAFGALLDWGRRREAGARKLLRLGRLGDAVGVPMVGPANLGVVAALTLFFGFQCVQSYRHAMDYKSDLDFWNAARKAVPNSAKAHLNYSVMVGARGDLEERLLASKEAQRLAPSWAMAHIYTGDTLCRLHRPEEAWPHYVEGFKIGANEQGLVALALQCLWDEGAIRNHEAELRQLGLSNEGSWLAYLAPDTLDNGESYTPKGVNPKYRPRSYNEGPKE